VATKTVVQSIAPAVEEVLVFDRYQLDTRRRVLLENGRRVRLGSRALSILILLAQRAGRIATKRELLSFIWPDVCVEEGTLRVHISTLRRALGTNGWGGRFVENISGQGYRLAEPVFYLRGGAAGEKGPMPQAGFDRRATFF
jgi:DNA-binding winged helix-turn-helix (wHTH) protein